MMDGVMGGDIGALAKALAAAQAEMDNAAKDGMNPHFKSAFATLASVRSVTYGPLSRHGLALTQHPSADGAVVTVRTLLIHEDGGWLATETSATAKGADPQSIGSAISYLRRYSLAAVCGVAQEDDDGQGATGPVEAMAQAVRAEPMTDGQKKLLLDLVKSHVFSDEEKARAKEQTRTLTKAEAIDVIDKVQKVLARRKADEAVTREPGEDDEELPLDDQRPRRKSAQEVGQ
jgi:hypothetical protein